MRCSYLAVWTVVVFAVAASSGQDRGVVPAVALKPIPESSAGTRDLTKLSPQDRQFYLSAKSGMEWLARMNKTDGRFLPGFLPALRVPVEGDHFLNQAGAAFALARAASFFQDDRAAALAKQALLTLLLETAVDAKSKTRFTAAPDAFVNRLQSAGMLLMAIHELPNPAADLLENADQLAHYLQLQVQANGSFVVDAEEEGTKGVIMQCCTGPALHGLILSQARQPAAWKVDALRKACTYHHAWWRQNKNMAMIPEHTAAYAEAYLTTKERPFADAVFEMNDWLCGLQYTSVDPRRSHWAGGFPLSSEGKGSVAAPDITSANAATSLAEACRVARAAGDAARLARYRTALGNCLVFVVGLQYTEANTPHFTEWYRQNFLLGGFHLSHQEGNLRIEYAQQAVAALVQCLRFGAE